MERGKASELKIPLELSSSVMCNNHPVHMPVRDFLTGQIHPQMLLQLISYQSGMFAAFQELLCDDMF